MVKTPDGCTAILTQEPRDELRCRCGCTPLPHVAARMRYIEGCVRALESRLWVLGPQTYRLRVTSGYRCAARNAAAGGARYSRHLKGDAVDLVVEERRRVGDELIWVALPAARVARWVVGTLPPGGVGLYGGDRAHVVHYDARREEPRWAPEGVSPAPRKGEI